MLNPPFNLAKILRFEGAMIHSKVDIFAKFGWWLNIHGQTFDWPRVKLIDAERWIWSVVHNFKSMCKIHWMSVTSSCC